jgi:hypothetical protein
MMSHLKYIDIYRDGLRLQRRVRGLNLTQRNIVFNFVLLHNTR